MLGSKHKGTIQLLKFDILVNENVTCEKMPKALGTRHKKKEAKWRRESALDSESRELSKETVDGWVESTKEEIILEMRRELVPSWREHDRGQGTVEQGLAI